jgi:TolB-like protein
MRHLLKLAICIFSGALTSTLGAQSTTQPVVPSTQPAAADLYLIPFSPLGGDNSLDWAGKAVQQNLLTDLARAKLHVVPADKPITSTADAQTAARAVGAKTIITGTYQVADTLVRFNGQILDTVTGNVLGGISATGAPRDLFTMEDALSAQALQQLLPRNAVAANNKPAAPVAPALQPPIVIQVIQPPAVAQIGTSSSYEGSALQQYVDSNRTPSTDYAQQAQDAQDRDTFGFNYTTAYGSYLGGIGYGYGYGLGYGVIYTVSPAGYHHGFGHTDHHGRDDER